jgi:hypothetical protein
MSHSLFLALTAMTLAPVATDQKPAPNPGTIDVEARAFDVAPLPPAPPRAAPAAGPAHAHALAPDHDRLYFDTAADGTVWVRGKTFKASFGTAGATYVPFLGSHAPRNFPLALRVDGVTIGGIDVAFDGAVQAVLDGTTVSYQRGPFVEKYLLTPTSVEQTFEFDELAQRGEIVVSLDVDSELEGQVDSDGLRFENALGGVRYGRAFAFHDELAATGIETRLEADAIELTVPRALVESAVGRLVIDPVLTTVALADTAIDEFAADTSMDATNANWITVFEEVFSATDHDIRIYRHVTNGAVSATGYVDSSGTDWRSPAIANHNLDDQYLVVAARGTAPNREIWGRTVEATIGVLMSAQFQISDGATTGDKYAPDVGGDASLNPTAYYCVVWEREFTAGVDYDIHARLVRTNATLVGGGTIFVDDSSLTLDRNPSISNSNGNAADADQDWNIVWEHEVSATNRNIYGARVHWDGIVSEPTFTVASSTLDERNPSATSIIDDLGGTRPWMVAFQLDNGANNWDVRCRTFNGTSIISTFDLSGAFPNQTFDQITPACDTDGGQFVVVWDERPSPVFFSTDIQVATLYSLGGALGVNEGPFSVAPGANTDVRPKVATAPTSASNLEYTMIVYDRDVGADHDVWLASYDLPNGGPVTSACAGDGSGTACPCGNTGAAGHGCGSSYSALGTLLYGSGDAQLSHDTFAIVASILPEGAPVLFFQGTLLNVGGSGSAFGDGLLCAGGTIVRLGVKFTSGGFCAYPSAFPDADISVQGLVPAAGAVRFYQGWYRDSLPFCTAATFNLTNALRVQWIP